jgi:hypothetical protein
MKDLKLKEIIKNINIIIPRNIRNSWFVLMPKFNEVSNNIFSILFVSITEGSVTIYRKGKIERTPATSNNTLAKVIKSNNKQSFSSLGDKRYK